MRYSSAAVLSTLVVGQAAANKLHNRHASFHDRRQNEVKRSPAEGGVNWDAVSYDLSHVDWNAVFSKTPAAAAPTTQAAQDAAVPQVTPQVQAQAAAATPAQVTSAAPAATTAASHESVGDAIGNLVTDVMHGVEALAAKIGAKVGKNDKASNGGIWIGNDSAWKGNFVNNAGRDMVLYCWRANGYSGLSVNVNVPDISVGLKAGQSVGLSFTANVPGACAPVFDDTILAISGGIFNTWWEFTMGSPGGFDVSRNPNMNGNSISSKGSICTSDMNTCVFKCKDSSAKSCWLGSDYDFFNCGTGGGSGYDPAMGGTGGSCRMGSSGETVNISFT